MQVVNETRLKIVKLLQNSSIKHLRKNMEKEKPDGIDAYMQEMAYRGTTGSNWSSLNNQQKEFYTQLADVNFLSEDYEKS